MDITAEQVIRHFDLRPLEGEGGMFRRTYLAAERIAREALPSRYPHDKPFGSAILYLLSDAPDSFSEMHSMPTDEVYHFYAGDPVAMLLLHADGRGERIVLGPDFLGGQRVQCVVPRGTWQGSRLLPGGRWALLGTTMAPAYTDSDYVRGPRAELAARFPDLAAEIGSLTRT